MQEEDRRIEEGITLVSPLLAEVKEIAEELKVLEQVSSFLHARHAMCGVDMRSAAARRSM